MCVISTTQDLESPDGADQNDSPRILKNSRSDPGCMRICEIILQILGAQVNMCRLQLLHPGSLWMHQKNVEFVKGSEKGSG